VIGASIYDAATSSEAAFGVLNWLAAQAGLGPWIVNLVCAAVFAGGLLAVVQRTPHPWLGLAISIPQIVIVVGMGYTRQSAAIGFICLGLVALDERKLLRFAVLVLFGALFHRTAVIMLSLGFLGAELGQHLVSRMLKSVIRWFWVAATCTVGYLLFLDESRENFAETYLSQRMISDGTYPRVMMNVTAALAYLILVRPKQSPGYAQRGFWTAYSWTSVPFVVAVIFLPPLTAIDRIALYWMPLQIYTCGHLPAALSRGGLRAVTGTAILFAYGVTQYVWLTYANFSWAWKPYRFYPIEVWIQGTPV
jgi:hypothetical protein